MLTFKFKGKNSAEYGIYLENRTPEIVAERQIEFQEVRGRDGGIMQDFGGRNDTEIELNAYQVGDEKYQSARAWLTGSGEMIFSTDEKHAYEATISRKIEFDRLTRNSNIRRMQIIVRIAPYAARLPEADAITAESGSTITNPGTAEARPRIKITGSGDVAILINDQMIEVDGLTDGEAIIIDSEIMECMSADGSELKNAMVSMEEFPKLKPGANAISWTGTIAEFKIEKPRWRDV